MATLRLRTRKDGSSYTSVLFRVDGKQSSLSFDDHRRAVRFHDKHDNDHCRTCAAACRSCAEQCRAMA